MLLRQSTTGLRSAAAHLPHPELICESAFEEHDDKLCVPRQLAELLRRSLHEVCDSFDAALHGPEWREVGVTGKELQKWRAHFGHRFYCVRAGRSLTYYEPAEQEGRIIACYIWDGHAYIYRDERALKNYKSERRTERAVLEHEKKSQLEWWSEGKLYTGKPEPGLFYVSDLAWERKRMLASGRSEMVPASIKRQTAKIRYKYSLPPH